MSVSTRFDRSFPLAVLLFKYFHASGQFTKNFRIAAVFFFINIENGLLSSKSPGSSNISFYFLSLQEQRVNISRAFYDWVRECHENHDKQVMLVRRKF